MSGLLVLVPLVLGWAIGVVGKVRYVEHREVPK